MEVVMITEILRLRNLNLSYRDIARSVGCSRTSVMRVLQQSENLGITYEASKQMTYTDLEKKFFDSEKGTKLEIDWDWKNVHQRLMDNPRLNLQYIWTEEYKVNHPDGCSYSQFCRRYRSWKKINVKELTMVQKREPGQNLYVDWAGDTLSCVYNTDGTALIDAHFFVATLGVSSYPFVEAFPNETMSNWIKGHVDAFKWYGGLPQVLVPDNCRTAIIKADLYEPTFNTTYRCMADFYNVGIVPARVKSPRDKGSVESCVGWIETWIIEFIRGRRFQSFGQMNQYINERVKEISRKKFQKREGSRESIFNAVDKPALRPLPPNHFEIFDTKVINNVPNDYHVVYDNVFYSVPFQFAGEKVIIHGYPNKIEVFDTKRNRIAIHARKNEPGSYSTVKNHMPEKHRISLEISGYTDDDYKEMANTIGEETYNLICTILEEKRNKKEKYRSCLGIILLSRQYPNERVEKACSRAISLQSFTYTTVKNILKNSQEEQPLPTEKSETATPQHENLRNGEWE